MQQSLALRCTSNALAQAQFQPLRFGHPREQSVVPWSGIFEPGLLSAPVGKEPGAHRDLHFVLPRLKAGESATLRATVSSDGPTGPDSFRWEEKPGEFAPALVELVRGARFGREWGHQAAKRTGRLDNRPEIS